MTIQSSIISSRLLLNCTIIARPLNSAKWKRHRTEIPHVKRVQINDYTVELLLVLELTASSMDSAFGMFECEAENQFKVSKAFINIDGKQKERRMASRLTLVIRCHLAQYNIDNADDIISTKTATTNSLVGILR